MWMRSSSHRYRDGHEGGSAWSTGSRGSPGTGQIGATAFSPLPGEWWPLRHFLPVRALMPRRTASRVL